MLFSFKVNIEQLPVEDESRHKYQLLNRALDAHVVMVHAFVFGIMHVSMLLNWCIMASKQVN
jgi:hypothetical protein